MGRISDLELREGLQKIVKAFDEAIEKMERQRIEYELWKTKSVKRIKEAATTEEANDEEDADQKTEEDDDGAEEEKEEIDEEKEKDAIAEEAKEIGIKQEQEKERDKEDVAGSEKKEGKNNENAYVEEMDEDEVAEKERKKDAVENEEEMSEEEEDAKEEAEKIKEIVDDGGGEKEDEEQVKLHLHGQIDLDCVSIDQKMALAQTVEVTSVQGIEEKEKLEEKMMTHLGRRVKCENNRPNIHIMETTNGPTATGPNNKDPDSNNFQGVNNKVVGHHIRSNETNPSLVQVPAEDIEGQE